MSPRVLAIALAISVALNLFGAGAVATLLLNKPKIERRLEADRTNRRAPRTTHFEACAHMGLRANAMPSAAGTSTHLERRAHMGPRAKATP